MAAFGALGYVLRKFEFDVAPLLMAPCARRSDGDRLCRALTISAGDYGIFIAGPAARAFLCALGLLLALQAGAWALGYRKVRNEHSQCVWPRLY